MKTAIGVRLMHPDLLSKARNYNSAPTLGRIIAENDTQWVQK
jgi:hypothetical protein